MQGCGADLQMQVQSRHAITQDLELNLGNLFNLLGVQRMEHHGFIDAVQELGSEMVFQLVPHRVFDVGGVLAHHALDDFGTDVGGHGDDAVFEVHRAALAIGQASVVQYLQQDVEHIRVGFFNLVHQDDRIRFAPDQFGEVAALDIAHVARGGTNEFADRVLLHELAHVDANQVVFAVKQKASQGFAQFGFAHTGGPQEQERSCGARRVAQARA